MSITYPRLSKVWRSSFLVLLAICAVTALSLPAYAASIHGEAPSGVTGGRSCSAPGDESDPACGGASDPSGSDPAVASATPPPPLDTADKCNQPFLGLEPWYEYMPKELVDPAEDPAHACEVKCFNIFQLSVPNDCGQRRSDIPGVLLAVIDDLLRIIGVVAIGFVFYGAFKYVESRGNPEKTAQAQSTIINALAGTGIAMVAVGFIAFLGNQLG